MNCPNCGAAAADGAADCAACGLVFAKWKALEERKLTAEVRALAETDLPPSHEVSPWLGRAIAAGLVAFWMIALGLYFRRHLARVHRKPLGPLTGDTAEVRDPETGELKLIPIRRGPGVKPAPPAPAAVPAEPAD